MVTLLANERGFDRYLSLLANVIILFTILLGDTLQFYLGFDILVFYLRIFMFSIVTLLCWMFVISNVISFIINT